jgi:hypothetical protein
MEFNAHNLIGVIIFLTVIGGLYLIVREGRKCIKILEKREEEKRKKRKKL